MGSVVKIALVLIVLVVVAVLAVDVIADAGKYSRLHHATPVEVIVCYDASQKPTSGVVFLDGEQLKFLSNDAERIVNGAICQVRFGDDR